MQIQMLGPVRLVDSSGRVMDLGGPRQRRLLVALVLELDRAVPTDRLIDTVFDGSPPAAAATTIRSYVARLRKAIDEAEEGAREHLETTTGGYRLRAEIGSLDAAEFTSSIDRARDQLAQQDPIGAVESLRSGLDRWRGDAFGDFAYEEWVRPEAMRLEELRVVATENLNEALLACGLAVDVVSAVRSQVQRHPLREGFRRQQMLALYRSGRQAEALRALRDFESTMAEVGLEPSAAIGRLGQSIAAHDPALRLEAAPGQPLRGYRIGASIGEGGAGVVYRAVQPGVGREVAIKSIRNPFADDPEFVRRFDAEAQTVANLEHPHIVPIYDYWREPGGAYVVMRLLDGNLHRWLDDGPLPVDRTVDLARHIGGALVTAHRAGVVHGDIKPSNVLVDGNAAYLADFGMSTLIDLAGVVPDEVVSSGHEAPEFADGDPPTQASDQFGLAVLLAYALTGQLPFGTRGMTSKRDRPPQVSPHRSTVPAALDAVLHRATSWLPTDRYADIESFVANFEAAITGSSPAHGIQSTPTNPYRGLHAFVESDSHRFFGRDAAVRELLARLSGDDPSRFVVVAGSSGSGKSSMVRAGLVPELRAGAIDGSDRWLIATMVPGTDPFAAIAIATNSLSVATTLAAADAPLGTQLAELTSQGPVLLVIDQLEELFTNCSAETQERFVRELVSAVTDRELDLRVVCTLRADFYDRPLRYADFGRLVKDGLVTMVAMTPAELEAAITRPAALAGVEIEPALVAELVNDIVDRPSALPLLQFTLTLLFDRRRGHMLSVSDYASLGGVEAAVAGRADEVFQSLGAASQAATRHLFLGLIALSESGEVSRRRRTRAVLVEAAPEIGAAIEAFGAARLLAFDHDPATREPNVDLAHEALLTHWPRLRGWVADDSQHLAVRSRLHDAAVLWDGQGRHDSDLIRGHRLAQVVESLERAHTTLSTVDAAFVEASRSAETVELQHRQAEAQRERRTNRRLRFLLASVGCLLAVAMAAATVALVQRERADDEAAAARIASLLSNSSALQDDQPELATLLALEAYGRAPDATSSQAVLDALANTTIGSRIAAFDAVENTPECEPPTLFRPDGGEGFTVAEGRRLHQDLTTGAVTDHGPARDRCGVWLADIASDVAVAGSPDAMRLWVGSVDDPYQIEVEPVATPFFTLDSDLRTGRVGTTHIDDEGREAVVFYDTVTGEPAGPPIAMGSVFSNATNDTADVFVAGIGQRTRAEGELAEVGANAILVANVETGETIHEIETSGIAVSVAVDNASEEVLALLSDGSVLVVDIASGETTSTLNAVIDEDPFMLGLMPDGNVAVVGSTKVVVIDRVSGPIGEPHDDFGNVIARPDGTFLQFGGERWEVLQLGVGALMERAWPTSPFARSAFDAGRAAVINPETQEIETIDLATGDRQTHRLVRPDGSTVDVASVQADPEGLWAISPNGSISRWIGDEMVDDIVLPGRIETMTRFGDAIAAVGRNGAGEPVAHLIGIAPGAAGIRLSVPAPDGYTAHPAPDGGIHVVDTAGILRSFDSGGELMAEIDTGIERSILITMDETTGLIATAQFVGDRVALIDVTLGSVTTVPFNPQVANIGLGDNGRFLVITSTDGSVRLWDVERGSMAAQLWDGAGVGPGSPSWYDAENRSMWVATSARLLEIPLDSERWIERACEVVDRSLTQAEWDQFVGEDREPREVCNR